MDNSTKPLQYVNHGWRIFPCKKDKSPFTMRGMNDATLDQKTIQQWWTRWPDALVGVNCERSGFFAVDIDFKNGKDGLRSWTELIEKFSKGREIETGPIQETPTGGRHILFRLPDKVVIPNNVGKLGEGLDLRSRGYICTGGDYKWLPNHGPEAPLTDAPTWLLELINKTNNSTLPSKVHFKPGNGDPGVFWLQHYLDQVTNGNRNNLGFDLACQLRDNGISKIEAQPIMIEYAQCVPGDDYFEKEAMASLDQAYRAPRREPMQLPGFKSFEESRPDKETLLGERFVRRNAAHALAKQPPIDWIVENLFSSASVSLVVGSPGTKKTYSMLSAAVCVAIGGNWLDFSTKKCPVLIIDEESGDRRMARRLGEVLRGEYADVTTPIEYISLAQFNLLDSSDGILLLSQVQDTQAGLVVIDALADIMLGGDENAVKDVQQVFIRLREIAERSNAAIVIIHHANKAGDYRGSTAMSGAVDLLLMMKSKKGDSRIDFEVRKGRDIEPFNFAAEVHWDNGQFWMRPGESIRKTKRYSKSQKFVLELLTKNGPMATRDIEENANVCKPSAARGAIFQLAKRELIYRTNPGEMGQGVFAIYAIREKKMADFGVWCGGL